MNELIEIEAIPLPDDGLDDDESSLDAELTRRDGIYYNTTTTIYNFYTL